MARVPTVIRNFSLTLVGNPTVFLGIADLELPTWTALTAELMGSGLAGKTDVTIPGHFTNLNVKISLHAPDGEFVSLLAIDGGSLEARGLIQGKDTSTGEKYTQVLKVVMVADGVKTANPGKLTPGEKSDSTVDINVTYVAEYLDGQEEILYDFYNYIYRVQGKDILAFDRTALGIN